MKPLTNIIENGFEVGPFAIELVDKCQTGDFVFIGLPPDSFTLRFDSFTGTKDNHGPIKYPQTTFYFCGEIHMTWSVDQINEHVIPGERHAGRVDRDAPLGFFGIVVSSCRATIDFSGPVFRATTEQHPLRDSGLAGIDMGDDPDVASF